MKKQQYRDLVFPLIIIILNFIIVFPWFGDGYPSSASVEPVVIAQAQFIRYSWPHLSWFPNWYLGYPYRLTGSPLLPALIALINFLCPGWSFWFVYRLITGLAFLVLPLGFYFLVKSLTKKDSWLAVFASLIFTCLPSLLFVFPQVFTKGFHIGWWPWQFFSLAYLGNGQKLAGLALVPFCLLSVNNYLKSKVNHHFLPILLISALALVSLPVFVSFLILWGLILLSSGIGRKADLKIKKSLVLLARSLGLIAFYYTPGFWLQALSSPSLAGKGTFSVIMFLGRILSVLLPLALGIVSVTLLKKKKNFFFTFSFLWFFIFAFLSLARFVADMDFWQDYTAWGVELGLGTALMITALISGLGKDNSAWRKKIKPAFFTGFILSFILIYIFIYLEKSAFLFHKTKENTFFEPQLTGFIDNIVEDNERIFVSGSSVFWLNSLESGKTIAQIRGGVDQAATHPWWADAAYQIREGEDGELAVQWLRALGVSLLVVHGEGSKDPYHDYVYPYKFEDKLKLIFALNGDYFYRLESGLAAKLSQPDELLKLGKPKDIFDLDYLFGYNTFRSVLLDYEWVNPVQINIADPEAEAVSLAITYDRGWQAFQDGHKLKTVKDGLGQLLVLTEGNGPVKLVYNQLNLDLLAGIFISLLTLSGLSASDYQDKNKAGFFSKEKRK